NTTFINRYFYVSLFIYSHLITPYYLKNNPMNGTKPPPPINRPKNHLNRVVLSFCLFFTSSLYIFKSFFFFSLFFLFFLFFFLLSFCLFFTSSLYIFKSSLLSSISSVFFSVLYLISFISSFCLDIVPFSLTSSTLISLLPSTICLLISVMATTAISKLWFLSSCFWSTSFILWCSLPLDFSDSWRGT